MLMDRREFLSMLFGGTLASLASPLLSSPGRRTDKPNVILCMADDQGWGDMAYTGHPVLQTPNFDAMAAEGLRFDRFYAAAPVCTPTRGSVMTGRHPNRYGCFQWGHAIRPQEITLAEALRTAGYRTGHFGKWHLGSVRSGSPANPGVSGFDDWVSAPNFFDNDPILSHQGKAVQHQGESSMVTVDMALDFICRHADAGNPFLAVVWFGSPHRPHEAAEEYRARYSDEPESLRDFYGEITGMDAAFGKLRNTIKDLGIRENTILWYCSDNGGLRNKGSTGGRGYKGDIYEGGLRVPAILEWPARLPEHRTTSVPCVTSDIYPTLLDIAGVSLPGQLPLDGMSLMPILEGRRQDRQSPIGFWDYPVGGISTPSKELMTNLLEAQQRGDTTGELSHLRLDAPSTEKQYAENSFPGHAAWLDWPWKLHRIHNESKEVRLELYNLQKDPQEQSDIGPKHSARRQRMLGELEQWQTSVMQSLNGKDYH